MNLTACENELLEQAQEVRYARTIEEANKLLNRQNQEWRIVALLEENGKVMLMLARMDVTWISTGEAGRRLGYSSNYILNLCKAGKLLHKVSDTGETRVLSKDVDRLGQEEWDRGQARQNA